MNAIEVRNVSKLYRRYGRRWHFGTLKSAFLSGRFLRDLQPDEVLEALKDVTFDVAQGRTLGVIGRNGSGKSTMLKLLAGIGKPTQGAVSVQGRISALIELGAGFHPEISGRENVFINGMMLGLSKREISARFDDIVAFAELEDFIDAPVKTYSSGMYMRLGFAVAINVDPDVLLVDEVLAVGDQAFTNKCLDKFAEFRRRGRTVLLVTHSLDMVTRFCDEALWLDSGRVRMQGEPNRIIGAYMADVARTEHLELARAHAAVRNAELIAVALMDDRGEPTETIPAGGSLTLRAHIRALAEDARITIGIGLFTHDGVRCYSTTSAIDGVPPLAVDGEGVMECVFAGLELVAGKYVLAISILGVNDTAPAYALRHPFTVTAAAADSGVYRPPHTWHFAGGLKPTSDEPPETAS
jgi:ABC-type polysaccharide/polyol phosphate transport system ATPase subunit